MTIADLLSDPKYNSAIIRSTGLLSGKAREERIIDLLGHNVWLAAKCKNTCILEEDSITDSIILKCANLYKEKQDPLSLVALMELGEAGVFCYLMEYGKGLAYKIYRDPNQSVPHLFSILGEDMPNDLFWATYNLIISLGYQMEIDTYNLALSQLRGDVEYHTILNAMESSGIKADATTYYHLITKSTTYNEAAEYYLQLKEITSPDSCDLFYGALSVMINMAETRHEVKRLYDDYEVYIAGGSRSKHVETAYCKSMLAFAEKYEDCIAALQQFCNNVDSKSAKKKAVKEIINTYCHQIDTLPFDDERFWTSFEMICDISQKRNLNIAYRKNNVTENEKSQLDKSLFYMILRKFRTFDQVVKLFNIMHRYYIKLHSDVICVALAKAQTKEDIRYILETYSPINLDPKILVANIQHFTKDMAELIYKYLVEIDYHFNIYIYNTLLKLCDIETGLRIFDTMLESDIAPDIQSIQPLIFKCRDKAQFIHIITVASSLNIQPDSIVYRRFVRKMNENLEFARLIHDINYGDIENYQISSLWIDLLATS